MEVPVSVVIPAYNAAGTLIKSVESVANQTYKPKEVIIVDDGSTDNTPNIIEKLKNRYGKNWIISILLSENVGPSGARNRGIEYSSQPYIAFLDADDAWHPQKLESQFYFINRNNDIDIISCKFSEGFNEKNNARLDLSLLKLNIINKNNLLYGNKISVQTVLCKKILGLKFDQSKRYSEDYYVWLSLSCKGIAIYQIEFPLVYSLKEKYYTKGLSSRLWKMEVGELRNYLDIYQRGCIRNYQLMLCLSFSFIKYLRRLVIYFIQKTHCPSR